MKFLIDAQLPRRLAHQLEVAGFETTHTLDLPQGNRTTDQISHHAFVQGRMRHRYKGL